jgi:shikimate kinase / 3-dehydroquinate synthase
MTGKIFDMTDHLFLYGPPGSGKTTLGGALAERLTRPFIDLDAEISRAAGQTIPQIFTDEGEAGFRRREKIALEHACAGARAVIALGGGALLDPANRHLVESCGEVVCLLASPAALIGRVLADADQRPLLADDPAGQLERLLAKRGDHYRSFPLQIDVTGYPTVDLIWEIQRLSGHFFMRGMGDGYEVRIMPGGLRQVSTGFTPRGFHGPVCIVADGNLARLHGDLLAAELNAAGIEAHLARFPAGEAHKTIQTLEKLWEALVVHNLERRSTLIALGGGVTGDLAGFAAATYQRGLPWINLPTSLLAMVDASVGGKTGANLPQGKNLVGAFHAPRWVLADTETLASLPAHELRNGLAEVIKHGVIADPQLFARCAAGWEAIQDDLAAITRRAVAVKLAVVEGDPYEGGQREVLNFGHTIGHGLEQASGYTLAHGEAVAIGMLLESELAVRCGLADGALPEQIRACLAGVGLPVKPPGGLDSSEVIAAMRRDKKKAGGRLRFALPEALGRVQTGVIVADWEKQLTEMLEGGGGI